MPPTPKEISDNIDKAIDDLNTRWDLGLPRLHGKASAPADESERLAGTCSKLIRFLCFKTDQTTSALREFEGRARQIHSQWVFKPSQERGTLPVLPVTKSLVVRKAGLVRLGDSQRSALLGLLHNVLKESKDNYELAQMSSAFSIQSASTSAVSLATAPTTPVREGVSQRQESFFTPSSSPVNKIGNLHIAPVEPQLKHPLTMSTKRTIGSPNGQNKRQQTLSEFCHFRPASPPLPEARNLQVPDPMSFETAVSPAASSVFSVAEGENAGRKSNDTSMVSSQDEDSQDLFPTQDYNEIFDDEEFSTSFNELSKTTSPFDPTDLNSNGPFIKQAILPSDVPFWYCWELHRLAPDLGLKPIELYRSFGEIHKKTPVASEEFWHKVKEVCRAKAVRPLPQKSDLPSWIMQNNNYMDVKTNKVAHFTAALDWNEDSSQGLLKLRLNALQLVQSTRFHRKFGADRFLALNGPPFMLPDKLWSLSSKNLPLYDKVIDFLASGSHFIAGRSWRVCFIEEVKGRTRRTKAEPRRSRIILFAETGFDIVPRPLLNLNVADLKVDGQHQNITRQGLMQWHMPLNANSNSMDLKLFSRWSIGFSRTTPTIELQRHEFLYRDDELGDLPGDGSERKVMNDGCALMSYPLAKAVWAAYGGEGEPPSAVQGRISGGKGLWLVDYQNKYTPVSDRGYWIEISESQLKIKPHPRDRHDADADATLRTFEVLKYASECKQAHLNIQLINILEDRGVLRSVLQEALQLDVQSFSSTLTEAMNDPRYLRLWMQEHAPSSRLEAKKVLGSFPANHKEQMKLLLESGFHPRTCQKLIANAYRLLSDYMTDYMDKMWIQIPHSTAVFCAPDPLGVLAPGEVYLGSSSSITHPVTGLRENTLEGLELLVARNPAHLASDMQKCRAVYKHELRHYKNVILFPQRGTVPLASLLSGGDYDGDVVTCIWDPEIVRHFCNTDVLQMPTETECDMVQRSEPISAIFNVGRPLDEAFEEYFRKCIAFNARSNLLGSCAAEHEKLIYALSQKRHPNKLTHSGAVKLAALAGFLVDSTKQGWDLTETMWHEIRARASGSSRLQDPAYKDDTPRRQPGPYLNVVDYLKFDVAQALKEQVLREFGGLDKDQKVLKYDRDLSRHWLHWSSAIEEDRKRKRREARYQSAPDTSNTTGSPHQEVEARAMTDLEKLTDLLEGTHGLLDQIKDLDAQWSRLVPQMGPDPTPSEGMDWSKYSIAVETVYEKFRDIQPKRLDHELYRRYEAEKDQPFSDWVLLKASCYIWWCARKAFSQPGCGGIQIVVSEIHDLYKVDAKFARALLEGCRGDGADEENAVDEEYLMDDDVGLEMD
ncbi:hypothetical protein CLAIMM_08594 [Cladophialophora immunda]|nr:hypothetical protein CLAIMM_08594 [Cladophialophora immunda]